MSKFKKRRWLILLAFIAVLFIVLFNLWQSAIEKNRQIPVGPFQIAGNLYYVGTTNVCSFLLTGPEGHVLIDGAYPETAPMIIKSISKLGYDITDVKVLLNSHAHADHAGGLAALKSASDAELWISEADANVIEAGGRGDPALAPLKFLQFFGLATFSSCSCRSPLPGWRYGPCWSYSVDSTCYRRPYAGLYIMVFPSPGWRS